MFLKNLKCIFLSFLTHNLNQTILMILFNLEIQFLQSSIKRLVIFRGIPHMNNGIKALQSSSNSKPKFIQIAV